MFAYFILCLLCSPVIAEGLPWQRVMAVSGKAEHRRPGAAAWRPLTKGLLLKKGTKLRTSEKSTVQIGLDSSFHAGAQLTPKSLLIVLSENPLKVYLEKGSVFFLCENEVQPPIENSVKRAAAGDVIFISTPHLTIQLHSGGFGVTTSEKGTLLSVYSESVRWAPRPTKGRDAFQRGEEGFGYWIKAHETAAAARRMHYDDYLSWQEWMKNFMELRDDALMP